MGLDRFIQALYPSAIMNFCMFTHGSALLASDLQVQLFFTLYYQFAIFHCKGINEK
jgi:hypothetical protein